jgi:inner membrane protein
MPTVGHVAVGLAAARVAPTPVGISNAGWATLLAIAAVVPDIDMIAFTMGVPYEAPFGHRGAIHSLAFAVLSGLVLGLARRGMKLPAVSLAAMAAIVMASHGLLDTLTDGGLGVALFWPFSDARYFAPWRPITAAPLGRRLFAPSGLRLMLHECVLFLPLFVVGLWPRRRAG